MDAEQLKGLLAAGGAGGLDAQSLRAKLIADLMAKRSGGAEHARSEEDAAHKRWKLARKRLLRERAALAHQCRRLAAALGACACFGYGCRRCHGEGKPGWCAPDEDEFHEFVAPLLSRMGLLVDDETQPDHSEGTTDDERA